MQTAMRRTYPDSTAVERQADTIHLGQSLFRHTTRATFSKDMFPGQSAERKTEQQKVLGLDMRTRCNSILNKMHLKYAGNMEIIARKMPKIIGSVRDENDVLQLAPAVTLVEQLRMPCGVCKSNDLNDTLLTGMLNVARLSCLAHCNI